LRAVSVRGEKSREGRKGEVKKEELLHLQKKTPRKRGSR